MTDDGSVDAKAPSQNRPDFLKLIKEAAAKVVADDDVWAKHDIPSIPAERVIRHMYNRSSQSWYTDQTIVKIQSESFAHGAMRHCFRMKKLSVPPGTGSHRFYSYGWSRASNYVAKCYIKDGAVDTSEEAKDAVRNDIILQYEAAHWADVFNRRSPPKKINFIRAYAMEFPDRPGKPLFAVERFISGRDSYGAGFVKHNTNSGYVDLEEHRITPQVFSAYTFYASNGTRLVADIQGVGDLYTDPQILSMDYRFGDGDLGPRGMALFFKTFRHCSFSDSLGIPIFQLSRNEVKHQAKYNDDEITVSDDEDSYSDGSVEKALSRFSRLDMNRQKRMSILQTPQDFNKGTDSVDTERRSNLSKREDVSKSICKSLTLSRSMVASTKIPKLKRTQSDVDEVDQCLEIALTDAVFDHRAFHRKASGEIKKRHINSDVKASKRGSVMTKVAPIMVPNDETQANLGKVHYHLACLHGMGRFPEIVQGVSPDEGEETPSHDVFSVLFHLCHAASLQNVPACLALARVKSGLDTSVSDLLKTIAPVDFEGAKDLLRRAMQSPQHPAGPKAAAGCLLFQILHDEGTASDITMIHTSEETLALMAESEKEAKDAENVKELSDRGGGLNSGDKVEANFALEGTFYPAVVLEVSDDGNTVSVQYDDDGSTETLTLDNVRCNIGLTSSVTESHAPLSDDEALGGENSDEKCIVEPYTLKAELAELKVKVGDVTSAATLFQEAADGAMKDGKMQNATKWSLRASELQD